MGKFIAGFLLGALATTAMFLLRPQPVVSSDTGPSSAAAVQPRFENSSDGNAAPNGIDRGQARSAIDRGPAIDRGQAQSTAGRAGGNGENSGDPGEFALPDEESLVEGYSSVGQLPPAAAPPSSLSAGVTSRPVEQQPSADYPPEIRHIVENRLDPAERQRYESDPREESWATYMEGQLQAYFASKPGLQQFNFTRVDCRTTVCAVHVLGYGPEALNQWNVATADIVAQPWHDFGQMSSNQQNPQPDVLGIVLLLTRKPQ